MRAGPWDASGSAHELYRFSNLQRTRDPSGAAKQLLKIAERHPEVLIEIAA
jgi:hypothetical protein